MPDILLFIITIASGIVALPVISSSYYIRGSLLTICFALGLLWFIIAESNDGEVVEKTRVTLHNVVEDKTGMIKQFIIYKGEILDMAPRLNGMAICKRIEVVEHSLWSYGVICVMKSDSKKKYNGCEFNQITQEIVYDNRRAN